MTSGRFEDLMRDILESKVYLFPAFGKIVSADRTGQTADVLPAVTQGGEAAPVLKKLPVLLPGGGGWEIDFPIQAGDFALVLFCGHNVFQWWGSEKESPRKNAGLPDAVVIPFTKRSSMTNGITLRDTLGTTSIEITKTAINIKHPLIAPPGVFNLITHTHLVGSVTSNPPTPGS